MANSNCVLLHRLSRNLFGQSGTSRRQSPCTRYRTLKTPPLDLLVLDEDLIFRDGDGFVFFFGWPRFLMLLIGC